MLRAGREAGPFATHPSCINTRPLGMPVTPACLPATPPRPAANCVPPSTTCVTGAYPVQTPEGQGCLSCFDLNTAVGPKCYVGGTASCTKDKCNCLGDYSGARCNEFVRPP